MAKDFFDKDHAQNVFQRMWRQYKTGQFCDVVLIAGREETRIPAHRSVLCASSDYFERMFAPSSKKNTTREAKVPSIDGEILETLVEYSYSGRITITEEIVEKLLVTADTLLFGAVVNACGNFLAEQLKPTNCLGMAKLAERHRCESLAKKAKDYCLKHFVELYKTDEFLSLNAEHLGQLLANDYLLVPNEEDVFKSLMRWLEHDPVKREQHKDQLLKLVRMPLMHPSFLTDHVKPVCASIASLQLYDVASEWHLLPERRNQNASNSIEPRKINQCLMAIRRENGKLKILYHCPQRIKWMKWKDDLENRSRFGVAVMGSDLFIVGGESGRVASNKVICLSLKTMTLKNVDPMNVSRYGVAVAALKGFLYAIGGYDGKCYLNSVEKWDPQINKWSAVAAMTVERGSCATTILNEKLYVVGGENRSGTLSLVESYDPQSNAWTTVAALWEPRSNPGIAVVGGMLYAVAGIGSITIERYDPENNKWSTIFKKLSIIDGVCTSLNEEIMILYDDCVNEYSLESNHWKVIPSIKGFKDALSMFPYSGDLLVSKFVEYE